MKILTFILTIVWIAALIGGVIFAIYVFGYIAYCVFYPFKALVDIIKILFKKS